MATITLPQPVTTTPSRPAARGGGRIIGVDLARGIALLGMFTVHVIIAGRNGSPDGVLAWLLKAPSGRASVLFVMCSGLALAIVTARHAASSSTRSLRLRGAGLIAGGVLLHVTVWTGSILEHYGVMFLAAPWIIRLRTRLLWALGVGAILLGPVLRMIVAPWEVTVLDGSHGMVGTAVEHTWRILLGHQYPVVMWIGFFMLGVALGRLNLRSARTARRLVASGLVGVLLVWGGLGAARALHVETRADVITSQHLDLTPGAPMQVASGDPSAPLPIPAVRDARLLLDTTPHANQPAWGVQAASIAVMVLGLCLLLPAATRRFTAPLAAAGSITLTAYLFHIALITSFWDDRRLGVVEFTVHQQVALLMALEALLVVTCALIARRWGKGPAERLLGAVAR